MKNRLFPGILAILLLVLTGCSASLPAGDSGSIGLIPFFRAESGFSGVVPATCRESEPGNFECPDLAADGSTALIVQQAYPGPLDELMDMILAQIDLERIPEPVGRLEGRAFDWELYSVAARVKGAGPDVMRVELAVTEAGSASYFVALVTPPEAYAAHPALFETVFEHAVYGLVPWE